MIFAAKAIQAGYSVLYAADAKVIHSNNYSPMEQFRRNFDLAVSQRDHPEVISGIRSEGEGIRLVKETAGYLISSGRGKMIKSCTMFPEVMERCFIEVSPSDSTKNSGNFAKKHRSFVGCFLIYEVLLY